MLYCILNTKGVGGIKRTFYYIQLVFIFLAFWIVLFERMTPKVLIAAPFVVLLSIFLSEKYLLRDSYYDLYYFNVFWLIKYGAFLFVEIYKSGFSVIPYIITGNAKPGVVSIHTDLESNFEIAILANSITLTPGTITIDVSGHCLMVLWLNPLTKEPTIAGKLIKGHLERLF